MQSYIPPESVANAFFEKRFALKPGYLLDKTGLAARRHGTREDYPTAMGMKAAEKALAVSGINPKEIDLIISAGTSRDHSIPTDAMIYAHKLDIPSVQCLHVEAVCLSFINALELTDMYIREGKKRAVLLISSEQTSRIIDYDDPSSSFLLGDGAAALIAVPDESTSRIISTSLQTRAQGKNIEVASLKAGGLKIIPSDPEFSLKDATFHVDGALELKLAVKFLPIFLKNLLKNADCQLDDLDHIIPHQVVPRMITSIMKKMGITTSKLRMNTQYGNLAAASMPVLLAELVEQNRLNRGDMVLLIGGAAGFSLGGAILVY